MNINWRWLLILSFPLIGSCEKNNLEIPEIHITFLDDVTPMMVRFEVEDNWEAYQWVHNDTLMSASEPSNVDFITHQYAGKAKVKLTVHGNSTIRTITREYELPPNASKISIYGFTPGPEIMSQFIMDTLLILEYEYTNLDTTSGHRLLTFNNADSIFYLNSPIYLDYHEFLMSKDSNGALFYFRIRSSKGKILYWKQLYNKHKYIIDNNIYDGGLKTIDLGNGSSSSFLNIDFMP